jgi:hypothetical protein
MENRLREDAALAREDLGNTVATLKDRADDQTKAAGWWASAAATVLAAGAAVYGVIAWRRKRRTPVGRAKRAWKKVTDRIS